MENQEIDRVILNYLRGEASPNEIELLRKWMIEHESNEFTFDSIKTYWEHSHLQIKSADLDKAYAKMKGLNSDDAETPMISHYEKERRRYGWYKYAAIFIVFFTIVGMTFFMDDALEPQAKITLVKEVIKENPKGQKLTTFLPDGSKVILNSNSKIWYNVPFGSNERLIELEGEAYFEVKKDEKKPFRVIANGISTTALGTRFNINSKVANIVEVALVTGRVRVSKEQGHSIILDPGKAATVALDGEFEIHDVDVMELIGWKDGILVFKDNTLPEIVSILEDWYGVDFIAHGPLETDFHYSGKYPNETLEEVLHGISFVHHFDFSIAGNTVNISSNHKNY